MNSMKLMSACPQCPHFIPKSFTPLTEIYLKSFAPLTENQKTFTKFVNFQNNPYLCTQIEKNMVIEYEKDYLEELYNDGKCSNKKYRFQKPVVTKYQKRIDTLMAATRIEDLFVFNSLNFEALDNGFYSIRIDYHYRLEFKVRQEGTESFVTICTVTDITNHYQ